MERVFAREVPAYLPAVNIEQDDMARVTPDDVAAIRRLARGYCHTVDATRSRKRADGSATISRHGYAPYGTDDASSDVAQDAMIFFAARLGSMIRNCVTASQSVATREPDGWLYQRKTDGEMIVVLRRQMYKWAVVFAADRNQFRWPGEDDSAPGEQTIRALTHAEFLAASYQAARMSEIIFRMAYGDGSDFPVISSILARAERADNLKHDPILADVAQELHHGAHGSRRQVLRTKRDALAEYRELTERMDDAREMIVYAGSRR